MPAASDPAPPAGTPPDGKPTVGNPTVGDPLTSREVAPATSGADRIATLLRWAFYVALLGAAGGTVYLSVVHRGPRAETRWLVFLVRRAAAVAAMVALAALLAQVAVLDGGWGGVLSPDAWADALGSGFGVATLLRLSGAGLVLVFLGGGVVPVREGRGRPAVDLDLSDPPDAPGPDTPVVRGGVATPVMTRARVVRRSGRDPVRIGPAPLAWLGGALLIASESFVGHTADTAPRALMVVDDALHLAAAGVWFAGVALLAATSWRRRGTPTAPSVAPLAARFSVLAAWSLVVVAATGIVMGALILGEVGTVWSSAFGRVLLLKVALVGGVAGLGAYHRRAVLPRLDEPGGPDPDVMARFRTTLVLEVVLFVAITGLTAVLVAANPVPG
jgi:putative copper export protein